MAPAKQARLDMILVARGLAPTRARARDAILRGTVRVGGVVVTKPGTVVADAAPVEIDDAGAGFASRGAIKLMAALAAFDLEPSGRVAIDVGASTGGFTDVLLQRGAAKVYAVDVGRGQLIDRLAGDPRVVDFSGRDARALSAADIPEPVGAITADVSFISLTKVLGPPLARAAPGCWLVALIKPQFELEPGAIGKGGIVKRPEDVRRAIASVRDWLAARPGWRLLGDRPSPIAGKDGNIEHLIAAVCDG